MTLLAKQKTLEDEKESAQKLLGQRIKKKRELLGLSQEELGKKVGYRSRSSLNKIELGEVKITQAKLERLADALQTTTRDLMGDNIDEETAIKSWYYSNKKYQKYVEKIKKLSPQQQDALDVLLDGLICK